MEKSTRFIASVIRCSLERQQDICLNGLRNIIGTCGLLEHNHPMSQSTEVRSGTIRSGAKLSLWIETHIGTQAGLKRLFTQDLTLKT